MSSTVAVKFRAVRFGTALILITDSDWYIPEQPSLLQINTYYFFSYQNDFTFLQTILQNKIIKKSNQDKI